MTDEQATRAPAGWYPVEAGSTQLRWWDGNAWTDYRHDTTAAAAAVIAQPAQLRAPEGTKYNTVWGWIIGASPALTLLLYIPMTAWLNSLTGAMSSLVSSTTADPDQMPNVGSFLAAEFSPAYFMMLGLGFLTYVVYIVLALLDWRALKAAGVPQPFHWAWSFFAFVGAQLVYIIGRSVVVRRRTGGGMGPLWLYIALTVVVFVTSIVVSVILVSTMMTQLSNVVLDSTSFS